MMSAFIGADGAGAGLFLLFGLVVLTLVSVPWFVLEVFLACKRKTYFSIPALLIEIFIFPFLYSYYSYFKHSADAERNRKKDYTVNFQLTEKGGVTVDGVPNSDEMILLRGNISFAIEFAESRELSGTCSDFYLNRIDGAFQSLDVRGISISEEHRLAFMASMPPSGTETSYRYRFVRKNHLFHFTCQSNTKKDP
jgi:hypothetical protein